MRPHIPSRLPRPPVAKLDAQQEKENCMLNRPEKKRKLSPVEAELGARRSSMSAPLSQRRESSNVPASGAVRGSTGGIGAPNKAAEVEIVQWEAISANNEEVEAILNQRMAGKNKYDYKGKCEQMIEYIKKLRGCVRGFQQLGLGYQLQKEALQKDLAREVSLRDETVATLKRRQDELEGEMTILKESCTAFEERLDQSQKAKQLLVDMREADKALIEGLTETKQRLEDQLENVNSQMAGMTEQVSTMRDLNARLQEYNTSLQQYNSKLQGDAAAAQEAAAKITVEKNAVVEELGAVRGTKSALEEQIKAAKANVEEAQRSRLALVEEAERARGQLGRLVEERDSKVEECRALQAENARYKEFTGKSAAEMNSLSTKATALEESYSSQAELITGLRKQLDVSTQRLQLSESVCEQRRGEVDCLSASCAELEAKLEDAERRFLEGEQLRKKLHNTIQELKGNIRVFCRVRPLLEDEAKSAGPAEPPAVQYPDSVELAGRGVELAPAQGPKYSFSFDKVFAPESQQAAVFDEISQLVQSALDGYKVCIFAYGQTGSGKTHTMLGVSDPPEARGMIPRSLEQIFASSQQMAPQGWRFSMHASMLEIYNESLRDLLAGPAPGPSSTAAGARAALDGAPSAAGASKQHTIKHDAQGNTQVSDLTLVEVNSWKEVQGLLNKAAQSRTVGRTAMNERSSRSHCVFTLRISGTNEGTERTVSGILNLIDLAGSERLSRSGATGDRLKETQAINKSLSSLGDVIAAIANKEAHIPYRNSKLTYLLQPCLGGNSKTLMFVNISPDRSSFNESLCSLRFAAKVNACEIGVPGRC